MIRRAVKPETPISMEMCAAKKTAISIFPRKSMIIILLLSQKITEIPAPEEKINQLNLALMNPTSSELSGDSGIGLKNVLHRLRIYFGEETQMRLTANSEGGVRITLTIPLTDARIDSQ